MSIFGSIVSAIFGSKPAATASQSAGSSGTTTQSAALEAAARSAGSPAATTAPPAGAPASAAQPMSRVDVEAMIKKIADAQSEDLNWRQSIVDLMKLLKLDSSLAARKQLAKELGYTGTPDGSAEMNIWLHKQVMTKLAESGGKVPEGLRT